jgi:plasmid stabilization system protein ParE
VQVIWSPAALREITHIYNYIAHFNPAAAMRLAERLFAAGDSLSDFPDRGRTVPGTALRELTVVYPYIIRHRVARDHVRILRVRHGARLP